MPHCIGMSMNWTIAPTSGDDSARETRTAKLISLEISGPQRRRTKIVVRNLSPHGIGGRGDIDLLPCERLVVHLPNGHNVEAIVRWVRKNSFGLSLDERIDADALQARAAVSAAIVPRDAAIGFEPFKHIGSTSRTGFKRSHRDEVLGSSGWTSS